MTPLREMSSRVASPLSASTARETFLHNYHSVMVVFACFTNRLPSTSVDRPLRYGKPETQHILDFD